jgi:putative membrane protein
MTTRFSLGVFSALPALFGVMGTSLAGTIGLGPLASHMIAHIILMNAAAPLIVLCMRRFALANPRTNFLEAGLLLPALCQIGVLWFVHTPFAMQVAMESSLIGLTIQVVLLLAAFWFWWNVFCVPRAAFWRPALALAITGKFYCLLGAILVFAPRPLYAMHAHALYRDSLPPSGEHLLADQQLAGLLMLAACPISYMLAGVAISARGLFALDESRIRVSAG